MNESDKKWLRNSYHDIRAAAQKLFYSIEIGSNICISMYVKIYDINDFICGASGLFENSAVSECSDYKRFYVNLRDRVQDLREHVKQTDTRNSVVREGIEHLSAVVLRDEALFGYSEEEAHDEADKEAKQVPDSVSVSYFTQYAFTLPVSLRRQIETDERINPENFPISAAG